MGGHTWVCLLTLVWISVKVPVIVSCSISFSSPEFVIGRLLFMLVFHVGLFVFISLQGHRDSYLNISTILLYS